MAINRTCPACGSGNHVPYLNKGELRLAQCMACSMVFATPVSAAYADGTYYEDAGRPFYLSEAKLAGDYSSVRYARELRIFRRFCRRGRVLDVGCSTGAFLYQLNSRYPGDYQVVGTDVVGPALDYAESRGLCVVREDFLGSCEREGTYDAITFWAVLEHLLCPREFVEKAISLLKPAGRCFILVPNIRSLAFRLLRENYRYVLDQHLNYFALRTLRRIIPQASFEIYASTMHFNPVVILQDLRRTKEPTDQDRAALLVKTNRLKANRWLSPVALAYRACEALLHTCHLGDNILLIIEKRN
jgi:2-polyprenyl-3-methyl-5-hydroxy-6-metoxy-1,4-benzoquinol methylase